MIIIFAYIGLGLVAAAIAVAITLALADWGRGILHRVAIDVIEVMARFWQMRIDCQRQDVELEFRRERNQARLEAWRDRSRLDLRVQRRQLAAGDEGVVK